MRQSILPYRWLTEQGHLYFQHLLQTTCLHPKKIDGQTWEEFHQSVANDVPNDVTGNKEALLLHLKLQAQMEAVVSDQEQGFLSNTRPAAIAALREWEEQLRNKSNRAEANDKRDSDKLERMGKRISG